jgi:DNA-binding MarR family transcriptional regulator
MAWRWAGRAEDLYPVALADRKQPLHVRGGLERGRQDPLGRCLADLLQEALEEEGLEADQGPRSIRLRNERVRRSLWPEGERARRNEQTLVAKQFENKLSHREPSLSSPSSERLRAWRLFFESALALRDVLDSELQREAGLSLRWYDVIVHLEETPEGLRMNELAERILYSKSGLTNVVDRMEEAGLVRRIRPENDRRSILVVLTDEGRETMEGARLHHRQGIDEHFSRHLADTDIKALIRAFEKVSTHARPLRPGRISR